MSKIICDICGTTYPSSTDSCPVCGCTNADAAELLKDDTLNEEVFEETQETAGRVPVNSSKKSIFDFDEVNAPNAPEEDEDEDEDDDDDEDDDEEEAPRHNTFVVILLTVLIVALLGVAAFIFVRYFMPNMDKEETEPTTLVTEMTQPTEETSVPTTVPPVPCEQMVMTNAGIAELSVEGQQFLLHIKALPENTTDVIVYTSADESIATVTEDGKITAVSEGETTIFISCGKTSIECPVIVAYTAEPTETEAAVEETIDETTGETAPVEGSEGVEETQPEETKEAAVNSDVKLKLKRTDIQLGVYYEFQLVLDCDLKQEDVTWTSEHPHIATVDEAGNVKAIKEGTTSITAKYGDQEVQCIVRCIWY